MNEIQALLKTKAVSPQSLLEKINQVMRENSDSDPSQWPLLRIHLRNGVSYTGFLAELKQDRSINCLSFVSVDSQGRPTGEAVFFETASVLSVSLLNAKTFAKWLSGGEIARSPSDGPAPSRLALKRLSAEISEKIQKKFGVEFNISMEKFSAVTEENALANAQDVLKELGNSLESVLSDTIGLEALRQFKGCELIPSSESTLTFSKSESQIQLHFDFSKALPNHWQDQLKDSLNSIL